MCQYSVIHFLISKYAKGGFFHEHQSFRRKSGFSDKAFSERGRRNHLRLSFRLLQPSRSPVRIPPRIRLSHRRLLFRVEPEYGHEPLDRGGLGLQQDLVAHRFMDAGSPDRLPLRKKPDLHRRVRRHNAH